MRRMRRSPLCPSHELRILRSFAVYAAQDDGRSYTREQVERFNEGLDWPRCVKTSTSFVCDGAGRIGAGEDRRDFNAARLDVRKRWKVAETGARVLDESQTVAGEAVDRQTRRSAHMPVLVEVAT